MVRILVRRGRRTTGFRRLRGTLSGFHRFGGPDGMNDEKEDLYALPPAAIKEPPHTLPQRDRARSGRD